MPKVSLKDLDLAQVNSDKEALILAQKILCENPFDDKEAFKNAQLIASVLILKTKEAGGNGNDLRRYFTHKSANVVRIEEIKFLAEMCSGTEASKLFKEGAEWLRFVEVLIIKDAIFKTRSK